MVHIFLISYSLTSGYHFIVVIFCLFCIGPLVVTGASRRSQHNAESATTKVDYVNSLMAELLQCMQSFLMLVLRSCRPHDGTILINFGV